MRVVLPAVLAAALVVAPATASAESTVQPDLDAIHAAGVVGVLAEVDTGPRTYAARAGVARLGGARPVPWDAHVRIGSVTKTFVAVVVLQLVDEGLVSLDDAAAEHLPEVGLDPRITVRMLLQHTSGLHNYTDDLALLDQESYIEHRFDRYTSDELVAMAMAEPPVFAPGVGWSYSNTNYVLAGMIIERVTGHEWDREVRDRITRPLGLRHTFSPGHVPVLPLPHPRGYTAVGGAKPFDSTVLNASWGDAAGDLISTADDVLRFWQALLGGRLLPADRLAEMRTTVPAWPGSGIEYGLGISSVPTTCGTLAWGHSGDIPGFSTRLGFTPDGEKGMVMAQTTLTGGGPAEALSDRAIDRVICG